MANREPSKTTLKIRAMARVERLRAKIVAISNAEDRRRQGHDSNMAKLAAELHAARKELGSFEPTGPQEDTPDDAA